VLHPGRTMTIHFKPDANECRIVYVLDADGLRGIQFKAPEGTTGFIDPSILIGMVRPVKNGSKTPTSADAERVWRSRNLEALLKRVRIVTSQGGDWHAIASDPMQATEIVARADRLLERDRAHQHHAPALRSPDSCLSDPLPSIRRADRSGARIEQ
jgi:hypothetical protein